MVDNQQRKWSGKLLDANGRQGTVEVVFQGEQRATWVVQLAERDGSTFELKGEIAVKMEGDLIRMSGEEKLDDRQTIRWQIELRSEKAGRYAQAAWVGSYAVENASDVFPLSRGVMICWQFA
jgi:hypothetical protein